MHFKRQNIIIFLLLVTVVVISTLVIAKLVLNIGFTGDEWVQLIYYKVYKFKPLELWNIRGLYTTTFAYYIGMLVDIFGLNVVPIQTVSIFFKILATLLIYPLILFIFKNKLLAFLTTIFYGINHATFKSLEYPIKGADYLGIIFMGLFLMVYVYIVRKSIVSVRWTFLLGFLFLLTLIDSPIRMYPLPIFITCIEIYIFIKKPIFYTLKSSVLRFLAIYSIPSIVFLYKPSAVTSFLVGLPYLYHQIINGDYIRLTTPFQGISFSFLTIRQFGLIGNLFKIHPSNYINLFPTIFGIFLLIIALSIYIQWKKTSSQNNILLSSFIGIIFTFIFVLLTWLFAGALGSFDSQQYYLVVASLGTSLFLASVLTLFNNCFAKNNVIPKIFIIVILIIFFRISLNDNNYYFSSVNSYRKSFSEQENIQKAIKEKIQINDNHEPILVYLDASSDNQSSGFYERAILTNFGWFMPLQDKKIVDGCIGLFYNSRPDLKKIVGFVNGKPVLTYSSVCIEKGSINYNRIISYEPKNFYAYKLNGYELIDIKKEVLRELGIEAR